MRVGDIPMFITLEDLMVLTIGLAIAVFVAGSVLHYISTEIEYRAVMSQKPVRKKSARKPTPAAHRARA